MLGKKTSWNLVRVCAMLLQTVAPRRKKYKCKWVTKAVLHFRDQNTLVHCSVTLLSSQTWIGWFLSIFAYNFIYVYADFSNAQRHENVKLDRQSVSSLKTWYLQKDWNSWMLFLIAQLPLYGYYNCVRTNVSTFSDDMSWCMVLK